MSPRRLLLLALMVTLLGVGPGVWLGSPGSPVMPVVGSTVAPPGRAPYAVEVLRAWDVRRSRAWSAGDPAALRRLYVAGSAAGTRDVRMLRAWQRRGLRVHGLRAQLLRVIVRSVRPRRLVIDVTDRLAGGVVAGTDAGRTIELPRDAASRRRVVLRVVAGEWRVVSVRAQPWAARRIARTPTSRNS